MGFTESVAVRPSMHDAMDGWMDRLIRLCTNWTSGLDICIVVFIWMGYIYIYVWSMIYDR